MKVFLLTVLVVLGCLCLQTSTAATSKAKSSPTANGSSASVSVEQKLKQITDLAAKSRSNMITLDDATYHYYAVAKPRPYSLIVFMTAAHPKFKCSICKQIDNEMSLVAQTYATTMAANKEAPKVFFVRLDYESSQKVFQNYGVMSVPMVFHIPSLLSADKVGQEYAVNSREKFQIPSNPDAESIANFLKDRTSVALQIKRSMIGSYITLLVVFGILALLVRPAINSLPAILAVLRYKYLWALVSAGVYTCAISGFIFDIIRSPPMYHANAQTGQIMFFYPQSGNQFVAEGFIIGFLNLGSAIGLIALLAIVPRLKDEQTRTISLLVAIGCFVLCFRMVRSLYIMKNNWYGKTF